MSTNKELFKEAIADAKAVREAALANAKAALEEALTPKLQSMLAAKLQEMEYEEEGAMGGYTDENLEEEDFMQPDDTSDEMQQSGYGHKEQGRSGFGDMSEDDMEEDFDLSEILAELNEAEEEAAEEEADEESEEESDEDMNVADMSVEELTDLIKSIVDQELEAEEAETMDDEEAEETDMEVGAEMGADSNEDEIDLEELLAELDALGETKEEEDEAMYNEAKKKKDEKEMKKEMEEAMHTIQTLRQEMNEVNLLNAKLLYVNKIFKAKNLTESQKLKVIASFDKATNVKEAKVVFESLNSALQAPAKKAIKESLGFASKATGVAQNRTIVESNDVITRMQKLANIIK
jgi:hypothetical protein